MEQARIKRELAARELARRNYGDYLKYVHGEGWKETRLAAFLAERVQVFLEEKSGNAYDILLIETPPQHGKSMTLTESLPAWYLGRWPEGRVILGSYNETSAERFARRNKEKVKRFGRTLFGVTVGGVDRTTEFELQGRRGRLISRGLLSGVTGNPAELMILDDPIKNRLEADSPVIRRRIWEEWQNSFKSRLAAGAKVILIMTPWHEDDLAARILKSEENVTLLRLPVEAEEGDLLGRKPGEPLCPELGKDETWLRQFKRSYLSDARGGERAWQALYQCRPRREEGDLVKRGWWKFYDPAEVRDFAAEVISVDAAFKGGENNDFVAITVWGKRGNDYFLRDCRNEHLDFSATVRAVREMGKRWPRARAVLNEDKANGSAVISVLSREMFCIPVDPRGGKVARVNAVSAAIESGHVYLPRGAAWLGEYLDQWSAFPAGRHDDCVDSSTQALSYLFHSAGERERKEVREDGFLGGDLYEVY